MFYIFSIVTMFCWLLFS